MSASTKLCILCWTCDHSQDLIGSIVARFPRNVEARRTCTHVVSLILHTASTQQSTEMLHPVPCGAFESHARYSLQSAEAVRTGQHPRREQKRTHVCHSSTPGPPPSHSKNRHGVEGQRLSKAGIFVCCAGYADLGCRHHLTALVGATDLSSSWSCVQKSRRGYHPRRPSVGQRTT